MKTLNEEDAKVFYKLWLSLLTFVNKKFKMQKKLGTLKSGLSIPEVRDVSQRLWDDVSLIDEYLDRTPRASEEHRSIIESWKRRVRGEKFILERHLQNGSIFIGKENKVYQVKGISADWEKVSFYRKPPMIFDLTLLPFKDCIIYDGLAVHYPVIIGPTMAKGFKDTYMAAKKSKTIQKTL